MTFRCRRAGFTFIEVLVVMIVIAILAVIVIPRYTQQKQRAIKASMESDLRNLAGAEEEYYNINNIYTQNIGALNAQVSQGNVVVVNEATKVGWSATVSNPTLSIQCYLWHGTATPVGSAAQEGVIDCS
jgi:prepilin-type N-terminal cleavage/methylation domain-containing protein